MKIYSLVAQIVVAFSIGYVWIFRFDNVVREFIQYGLADQTRNMVGATKIALSTLLVAGIWYPSLVFFPALLMAILMLCAQYYHFKVGNPWFKHAPSLFLFLLCLFIASVSHDII
jgi:hypothetical protein